MPRRNWYSIQAMDQGEDKVVEIRIYDEIGFFGTTAKAFTERLDEVSANATRILVSLNTPGGSVFDSFAIYNALVRHPLHVTTRVDGVAASGGSLIFMAGDDRVMPENAMLMVHDASTDAYGTAKDLRRTAEMMDRIRPGAVAAYARSGKSEAEIIEMMESTTWMDAFEAQAMGFSTAMEAPIRLQLCATAIDMLAQHDGVPTELITALEAGGDEAPAPEPSEPPVVDPVVERELEPEPAPVPVPEPGTATPAPPRQGDPAPTARVALSAGEQVQHVYAECRARRIPHLAEGILVSLSSSLTDGAAVKARLDAAEQIAGICLAAKLQDRAGEFVSAGLGVEQVRARLFESVVEAANGIHVSNLQRPPESPKPAARVGLNPSAIYAARHAHRG